MAISAATRMKAWGAVQRVRQEYRGLWAHVSDDVRWALVVERLYTLVVGQDWIDNPEASVAERASVATLALDLWMAAAEIRALGWKKW